MRRKRRRTWQTFFAFATSWQMIVFLYLGSQYSMGDQRGRSLQSQHHPETQQGQVLSAVDEQVGGG